MTGMSEYSNLEASSRKVAAPEACLISARGPKSSLEVLMNKTLTVVSAAALVAALSVGATVARNDRMRAGRNEYQHGIMPEVVVKADVPRLVMPTVEVHAYRTVAANRTAGNVF